MNPSFLSNTENPAADTDNQRELREKKRRLLGLPQTNDGGILFKTEEIGREIRYWWCQSSEK